MAQNIINEHNSSRHVDFSTPMPTHNSWQPKTNCLMRAGRRDIEDAIERNSWGKSGCEWMCCFPNTGGLHRTSGDAPPDTGVFAGRSIEEDAVGRNTHPAWCHVSKSNSLLSRRTKWPPMPTKTNHTSLQGLSQNTKEKSMPIENSINRFNISKMCKYVMSHQTGGFNI
jgi:hypothetical protein